jgi:hypothetical protein
MGRAQSLVVLILREFLKMAGYCDRSHSWEVRRDFSQDFLDQEMLL